MRITTKLRLAAFVPIAMALAIGIALVFSFGAIEQAGEKGRAAQQIINSANNLTDLARSYLLHREDRPRIQFQREYASVQKLISSVSFQTRDQQEVLRRIHENAQAMNRSFLRLVPSWGNGISPTTPLHREAEELLTGHVLVRAHAACSDALLLENLIDTEIVTTQRTISALVFALILATALPLTVLLLRLSKTVTASLAALLNGAKAVGAGDLDYRIGMTAGDEIGEVSRAFDRMAASLQSTTAARTELEREITERKRAEEEARSLSATVQQERDRLSTLVDSISDEIWFADAEKRLVLVNRAVLEEFGLGPGEMAEVEKIAARYEVYRPDGTPRPADEAPPLRALKGEVVRDHEEIVRTPATGELRHRSVNAVPVCNAEGAIIGSVAVVRDITQRRQLERQREDLYERERHIAEMLQQSLIPAQIPTSVSGCHFAARYVPALDEASVGGDFYDVFDLGEGKVAVLIGDVAGKGVRAAMQVSAARYAFRSYAYIEPRPSRVVRLVNDALCRGQGSEIGMLTAFYAVVDTSGRAVSYANAGHEPPALRRACGSVEELDVGGRMLGVMPGGDYPEGSLQLEPGDVIVLVTDGITEARSEERGMFGKPEMLRFVARDAAPPEELVDHLLEKAKEYGDGQLQDDVAIVALGLETSCIEVGRSD